MTLLNRVHAISRRQGIPALLGGVALLTAACGSAAYGGTASGGYDPPGAGAQPGSGGTSGALTVKALSTHLGTLLTDGQGRTLYLFEKDQPGTSACTGACLSAWPAFTVTGSLVGGPDVSMSMLSTIRRPDGGVEVAYNGHPLYHYAGDSNPGDTNGQGLNQFGAEWYVVSPNGSKIDNG